MNSTTENSIASLPYIRVASETLPLIADCLEDGQSAIIHRHATMEDEFGLEVVASRLIVNDVPKLSMLGSFTYKAAVDPSRLHVVRDRYLSRIKDLQLGGLGVKQAYANNEKKSLRLAFTDERNSVTTWFSPAGTAPYMFYVSNDRRDGNNHDVSSVPPKFDRETLQRNIITFMKLLSIPHRVLGEMNSDYPVDLVEQRSPAKQPHRSQRKSRAEKQAEAQAKEAAKQKDTPVAEGRFQPRLPNPDARLEQVHGIDADDLNELEERILTFSNPELAEQYNVRCAGGILIHGPAGTGKTMAASAICNEIGASLWQVDAADVINKFVGQSATNTKEVFVDAIKASQNKPLVMLFDEIDSIIGSKEDHNAERAAALGEFKRSLGHISSQVPNILVVATTNHMEKLDEAFMRDGRFDIKVWMKLPDENARLQILMDNITFEEVQDKRLFDPEIQLEHFEKLAKATKGMSGATIAAIIKKCRLEKFRAHVQQGTNPGSISYFDIADKIDAYHGQSQVH